jgi:hypothetical protein
VSFAEGSSDPNPDETGYGAYYAIWKYVPTYLDFDGLSTYDSLIKTEINGKVDADAVMVVLEYGVSTWDDFLAAYEANRIVYCRVSSPYGFRMAFLAFRQTTGPTVGAEFQYYRSLDNHSDAAQGDEIYIYHLFPDGRWTTTVRQAYTRVVAGSGLKSAYANGALTLSNDAIYELPPATTSTLGGVKVGSGLTVASDGTVGIADGAVTGTKLAQNVREAINISSAADALMGDPSESTWSRRTSTGSGMARVESVQGATEVQDGELVPVRIAGIASTDAQGGELDGVEWTAQTLRAAGSVRDELTSDELVTRVGVVDLGTLAWSVYTGSAEHYFRTSYYDWLVKGTNYVVANVACARYAAAAPNNIADKTINVSTNNRIVIKDDSFNDDVDTFKASLNGVLCYYALTDENITIAPISPALPMTYRVEQGGTESIIVPDGEISAAPVITVAEGESATDVVMDALACIATPDGPTATANHAANTYLTMQGKLYKVTAAIAAGESIIAGTNVTETTVMDGTRMVVLKYGKSTWNDFLAAYNTNKLVYCQVPVGSTGQRMAFLAYVSGNVTTPTFAEFQYYRSMEVSKYSATQQGDEVYVYTLKPNNNT